MANIVNARIDERLIHGQVAAFWTNELNASRIMVIDDLASKDEIQKMALKMACPSGVKLSILSINRAVERLSDPTAYEGERIFIVLKGTKTAKEIIDKGAEISTITVGNISNKPGSTRLYHTVSVTKEDVENARYLAQKGVRVIAQMVPSDEPQDFIKLVKNM